VALPEQIVHAGPAVLTSSRAVSLGRRRPCKPPREPGRKEPDDMRPCRPSRGSWSTGEEAGIPGLEPGSFVHRWTPQLPPQKSSACDRGWPGQWAPSDSYLYSRPLVGDSSKKTVLGRQPAEPASPPLSRLAAPVCFRARHHGLWPDDGCCSGESRVLRRPAS